MSLVIHVPASSLTPPPRLTSNVDQDCGSEVAVQVLIFFYFWLGRPRSSLPEEAPSSLSYAVARISP